MAKEIKVKKGDNVVGTGETVEIKGVGANKDVAKGAYKYATVENGKETSSYADVPGFKTLPTTTTTTTKPTTTTTTTKPTTTTTTTKPTTTTTTTKATTTTTTKPTTTTTTTQPTTTTTTAKAPEEDEEENGEG